MRLLVLLLSVVATASFVDETFLTSSEHNLWSAIQANFRTLNRVTATFVPSYTPGKWGIAATTGRFAYGDKKTGFIVSHLLKARKEGRLPSNTITCEAGFNAGHSATIFLASFPQGMHYEFSFGLADMGKKNDYEAVNSALFRNRFFKGRFEYYLGRTSSTLKAFAAEHPGVKCDVVFVDGAKGEAPRREDIFLFREISKPGAMLFGDEATTDICMSGNVNRTHKGCTACGTICDGTHMAYNDLVRSGVLRHEACSAQSSHNRNDLVCLWNFNNSPGSAKVNAAGPFNEQEITLAIGASQAVGNEMQAVVNETVTSRARTSQGR